MHEITTINKVSLSSSQVIPEYRINVDTYEANRLNKGKNGAKWPKSGEFRETRKKHL
ncbi:MAG: hypothetical protein U9Q18_03050 [Caldisericota bacterium]|nr:hypothetical protein [Caldisericota bacterium]